MAYQADNTLITNREMLGELIAAPFRAFFDFLVRVAENDPRMVSLQALSQKTDAELAAVGRTRQGELSRIMGGHGF